MKSFGASRFGVLWRLRLPTALPLLLTLIWPELPSVPFCSTAVPVRSSVPLSVTVPAVTVA